MSARSPRIALARLSWFLSLRRRHWLLLAALAVGIGVSGWLVWRREWETRRDLRIAETRRRLDRALELDDPKATEELLVQLADLVRHEPVTEQRLAALRRGEADPGDGALARLLMNDHLRGGRRSEAEREAAKVVAVAPGDMLGRGVLARAALRADRTDEARAHLAAVPSPHAVPDTASPGALLLMLRLKHDLGEDDADYLSFITARLLPLLKSRQADQLAPETKLQLLRCYHEACRALDRNPDLGEYWVAAARLIGQLDRDASPATAVALAREEHLAVLYRLKRMMRITEADATVLIPEFENRLREAWMALQARDERDALPYVGLALASQRHGDSAEALRWLDRGLKVCGDVRELYLILGRLLYQSDPLAGATFLERAYQRFPNDPEVRQMLAELAAAAGRLDRARDVCRAARAGRADLRWACRLEAAACLGLGRPTQAAEALAPLRSMLPRDAAGMELYVRAVSAVGAEAVAEELLDGAPITSADADGHAGAAQGYLQAGRPADAVRRATLVLERFPDHVAARRAHAEGLRLQAESGDAARWPVERVREAITAFDWLRQRDPGSRHLAQRIAWLELKGLDAPELALRSAGPLREGTVSGLSVEMNETLGAVLLATGQAEAALRPLRDAIQAAPAKAGPYIHRAAAYPRLERPGDARADLDQAATLARTPRESAEWQRVSDQLRGMR